MHDWLPLDVIDLILSSMPDLSTLKIAIQVNKRIYGVFLQHSSTIRTSVAYNEVGPALPQACYFAILHDELCEDYYWLHSDWFASFLDDLPEEDQIDVSATVADPYLTCVITKHAKTHSVLKNYYFQRYMDPAATTSSLTYDQLFRFTRALYRAWSYLSMFYARWASESERLEGYYLPEVRMAILRDQQRAFLLRMCMGEGEGQQFCALISFLHNDLVEWVLNSSIKTTYAVSPMGECTIPDIAGYLTLRQQLIAEEYYFSDHSYDMGLAHFELMGNAATILNVTLVDPPSMAILGLKSPHYDCVKCGATQALRNIYNHSNWNLLHGDITLLDIMHIGFTEPFLRNTGEYYRVGGYLDRPNFDFTGVVRDLLNIAAARGEALAPQDWLCLDCIKAILRAYMMDWWLERKRLGIDG